MRSLWRMALISTIATYVLIFIGGLVRVSGAGLGCPDWPKCFGRWIPPTDVSQLPPGMDPALFNFTLAWIEYFNRLSGVIVGVLIAITAVVALLRARRYPAILWPAVVAALLTAFQGWQGSVVIASELEPFVVSVHMFLALIIVSLLIWVTVHAYYEVHPTEAGENYLPKGGPRWVAVLWGLAIIQVILGTQLREGLEVMREEHPVWPAAKWIVEIGAISHLHMALGIVVAVVTWWVGRGLLKGTERMTPLVKQSIIAAMVLAGLQILSGLTFIFWGIPPIVQVFHLWFAALYVGTVLIVLAASRRSRQVLTMELR